MTCGIVGMTSSVARATGVVGVLCCGACPTSSRQQVPGMGAAASALVILLPWRCPGYSVLIEDLVVLVPCVPAQTKAPFPTLDLLPRPHLAMRLVASA